MPGTKLKTFLDEHQVKYVTIKHSVAYTAPEIAASAHVAGKDLAKVVMVKLDGDMAMAVVRAIDRLDRRLLGRVAGADTVELAAESEFVHLFPQVEPGAMPPFGNLYGVPVFVDEALARDENIAFNAGSHSELVQLAYRDFVRLVKPTLARFTQ